MESKQDGDFVWLFINSRMMFRRELSVSQLSSLYVKIYWFSIFNLSFSISE